MTTKYRVMIREFNVDGVPDEIWYSATWMDENPLTTIERLRARLAKARTIWAKLDMGVLATSKRREDVISWFNDMDKVLGGDPAKEGERRMSDFKPNTCETCKHLVADNQYCKKFESFYVVNRPGDFEKKSKCWVPKSWFVEIARLERELAEQKEACKLAQEAALISCAQNEGFKKELAAAREENARLATFCSKHDICLTCGYMSSADGEIHVCKGRVNG